MSEQVTDRPWLQRLREAIVGIAVDLVGESTETVMEGLQLHPPKLVEHGELSTNAAMVLASRMKQSPRKLAEIFVEHLSRLEGVARLEIAGPGFINLWCEPWVWHQSLRGWLTQGKYFGRVVTEAPLPIQMEYVSANPTGPMHVGHVRGAVVGDVLARLLAWQGHHVEKEYYCNDAGQQIVQLLRSVHWRACHPQADVSSMPEGLYPGDYLAPIAMDLARSSDPSFREWDDAALWEHWRGPVVGAMEAMIRDDLAALGVRHDHWTSEYALQQAGAIEAAVDRLKRLGWVEYGRLAPPKEHDGAWDDREQWIFCSTRAGDDADRALTKLDGSWTYFAGDLAYTAEKIARGFAHLHMVLGADHGGYVRRLEAAVAALSDGRVMLSVHLSQLVQLMRGGEPVRMSKRAGHYITARALVDEVGSDAVRFMMLSRKHDMAMDFDMDLVRQQTRENPVFYVQYAHARACSVLRLVEERWPGWQDEVESDHGAAWLSHPAELALLREMDRFPSTVAAATAAAEPHRLVFALTDLAGYFHSLWHSGKEDAEVRLIHRDDRQRTLGKMKLLRGFLVVMRLGMSLCGVTPLEQLWSDGEGASA